MSTPKIGTTENASQKFGPNEWLVDELYEKFITDKNSVDQSWWPILERYEPDPHNLARTVRKTQRPDIETNLDDATTLPPETPLETPEKEPTLPSRDNTATPLSTTQPVARTTSIAPKPQPLPAQAPLSDPHSAAEEEHFEEVTALKGIAKKLSDNMERSLTIPTATSVRSIPAKLLIDNRIVINNHLRRSRGGKVSFTHLIAWALINALKKNPYQNFYHEEIDGKPSQIRPAHVNLGIAIDLTKQDGTRSLIVPNIKMVDTMHFAEFLRAYEDLIKRAKVNKLTPEDFANTTISITNPGTIGTVHSMPRLMAGQGSIIGVGALEYPAEFEGSSVKTLANMGISKTVTLTSTYDHRVIQGAESGNFLKSIHEFLIGEHDFYNNIFTELRIPYIPIIWARDINVDVASAVDKTARVQELINSFRVRGHLMADIDPLEYVQRSHPDLAIESHGLTFWDLDREFVTGQFGPDRRTMLLRDILGVLRDSYCRTVGIEYMHIQDPKQRTWIQNKIERPYQKPSHDDQLRILKKLNEAEAFETFLQTKYVGQKRFSLEGGESFIPLLDAILQGASSSGLDGATIGMTHRGRLNALTNIAGKTYGQIFREFEGTQDPRSLLGSGDVKYHLGTEGIFRGADGSELLLSLVANPSHLEAADAVLLGITRAKQDRCPPSTFTTLPLIVHGDAALAAQGVVYETLQMSQLRAYRTGGTIHININNQIGFTTSPSEARTSIYSTDIAKTIQAPIFHVNGDDPEAVVRVGKLAFEYRQEFKRDVFIDLVCYRRRGHNEGDNPSMTQPLMYNLIEAKRSVRKLYTEALVGRGDITEEEHEQAHKNFQERLEHAFMETHAAQTMSLPIEIIKSSPNNPANKFTQEPETTAVNEHTIALIGDAFNNPPSGFNVHPKVQQLLLKRVEMSRSGNIDWSFGELLALGSLLLEGTAVRFAGQDSRRGTFVQRHATIHDRLNGQEWLPLANISEDQARFWIYDSLLSEYAALGFEYGYSVERKDALIIWEAQFGDFANGAQTIIDEFISSAEQKWNQSSSLVMLLPHGYEGQGPDHSSARIERYLQLCAENNIIVARPSTSASYFHLLRRQAYSTPRRPLIVFTPKTMLRMKGSTSVLSEFTTGRFEAILDDDRVVDRSQIKKVLLTSGKIYHDLCASLEKAPDPTIAVVRLEQFYPLPAQRLKTIVDSYPNARLAWVQEEPENQGVWPYFVLETSRLSPRPLEVIARPPSASPATGSAKLHAKEHEMLLQRALHNF